MKTITYYESDLKELEGKKFTDVKELEKAEAEVSDKAKAEQERKAKNKAEAKVVEDAILAKLDAEEEYDKKVEALEQKQTALFKKYKEELAAIYKEKEELEKPVDEARKELDKKLNEFLEKHPEGFYSKITDKNGTTRTYSYKKRVESNPLALLSLFDPFIW